MNANGGAPKTRAERREGKRKKMKVHGSGAKKIVELIRRRSAPR